MLDYETSLNDGDRRALKEQLNSLLNTPDKGRIDRMQRTALEALRQAAPRAWDTALPILTSILTTELRVHLGLPPG